ncbi:UDP-4-amino-4,6-dideoxy-N-acetyl-beta-L-altrosamine transaminase [Gallaecimonas kandeliae]|uniref:UDP-4-amino-4, 6-dideoxy-N-acetyl-beta-L-altrosamine transaminase n=1 Tax=Gallaecimonas kandeliae TaxID=3029055 RepID=UPI0026499EE5|nr:UDP-4-amino-4,6-dideoxy-N-acetyl-beta-L-altrosamine transaminase [Gallaecimonas kandeliae]WKE66735.1 UDP-4-amino-4,6-dideoxy-N-acetyl-beta-L-altrosamine transaminase [Gallaecimonas kandeliae]
MIPYGRQSISQDDLDAVIEVLQSDFLTQGPMVPRFEAALAEACGAGFAVASNSATSSLHLACLALDLGPGDRLWTSAVSFVASANCGRYCGADVDFVDINPLTGNLCLEALAQKLKTASQSGTLPKVLVVVHLAGQSLDMAAVVALTKPYGIKLVEDASHAIGAWDGSHKVGSCAHSNICVFSFHPVKPITSGEGGAALTNDPTLAERMALLRSHGITRDPMEMPAPPDGDWYYAMLELGFNYRMTDLHAALGLSQLKKLPDLMARRQRLAAQYDKALPAPWRPLRIARPEHCAYHLYVAQLPGISLGDKAALFHSLREKGIGVNLHYIPIPNQPYYQALGQRPGDYPGAQQYYRESLTLPLFADMTDEQLKAVLEALR